MGYFEEQIKEARSRYFDEELLDLNNSINTIDYIKEHSRRENLAEEAQREAVIKKEEFEKIEADAATMILGHPTLKDWFEKIIIPLSVVIDEDKMEYTDEEKIDRIKARAYKTLVDRILKKGRK